MRSESAVSAALRAKDLCSAIWPSRERNQLMKTFAAFAWGARFKSASVPYCVTSGAPSFKFANSSTGNPWSFALSVSAQKKHRLALPVASQSILWRKSRKSVTSISPNSFLMKVGPIAG